MYTFERDQFTRPFRFAEPILSFSSQELPHRHYMMSLLDVIAHNNQFYTSLKMYRNDFRLRVLYHFNYQPVKENYEKEMGKISCPKCNL